MALTLAQLHNKRAGFKRQLTDFTKQLNERDSSSDSIAYLISRFEQIEIKFSVFDNVQSQIEDIAEDTEREFDTREECETKFHKIKACIINLKKSQAIASPQINNSSPQLKLPTINLPSFDGDYSKWHAFHDTFLALIHNNQSLTKVQKLCYLRSSLKGEASNVIQSFETTDDNYDAAFDLLKNRFSKHRRIIYSHVNAILTSKPITLKSFVNSIEGHLHSLESLNISTAQWDAFLVPLLASKLDSKLIRDWDHHINTTLTTDAIPQCKQLMSFLLERADSDLHIGKNTNTYSANIKVKSSIASVATTVYQNNCNYCKGNHSIYTCTQFLDKDANSKYKIIKDLNLCVNCLRKGHSTKYCKSSSCKKCPGKHNTLLHFEKAPNTEQLSSQSTQELPSQPTIANCSSFINSNSETLLQTAEVIVLDKQGNKHIARALLDPGAQSNFITESLAKRLNLEKHNSNHIVNAFNMHNTVINHCTTLRIKSATSDYEFNLPCLLTPHITNAIPIRSFSISELNIPKTISLADSRFNLSRDIDILINSTTSWSLYLNQRVPLGNNLQLHQTKLGWIVSGDVTHNNLLPLTTSSSLVSLTINQQLEKFWQLETFNANSQAQLSKSDSHCEDNFASTTYRDSSGRFVVTIPLKDNKDQLGMSKELATKRFYSIEKRLNKEPETKALYSNFIKEYLTLGHMEKIDSSNQFAFFLPHHPVIKESSETTKLRVVFDGSLKSSTGISLNDIQHVGPTIQSDLFSILIRFRKHAFVVTADIEKMYRQILIHPSQRHLQQILWRNNPNDKLDTFQLNTVTYGTASAPYLAIRCLHELANQHQNTHEQESITIKRDFYVDDLLTGHDDIETLTLYCNNINHILSSAGFHLRKWKSNAHHLKLNSISLNNETIKIDKSDTKTLGICYNPSSDTLYFTFENIYNPPKATKRTILSSVAQIFDPLGLLSPITVIPKIVLQSLWKLNLEWDETIPVALEKEWQQFCTNLHSIDSIQIPRHVIISTSLQLDLIGFADASEKAYGACLYIRSRFSNKQSIVRLLTAKSRIAPVRQISLPRLELCAAVLLAQLADHICNILDISFQNKYFYSDSTITLAWIRGASSRWKTFVANRVAEIQNLTKIEEWRHVSSENNPADIISRGTMPQLLSNKSLWWHGPEFLQSHENLTNEPLILTEIPEQKILKSQTCVTTIDTSIFNRYSNFRTLINVVGYCYRFINNCKNSSIKIVGPLSQDDRKQALDALIKLTQRQMFSKEINLLSQNKSIHTNSRILSLSPFLDKSNILRVGGRLRHSQLSFDKKFQILLPSHHPFTELIAKGTHSANFHCGQQQLLNIMRDQYWPISGKQLVKKICRACIQCYKAKPKPYSQIMGNLPNYRITPSYPFYHCGVDYAGPFLTRDRRSRGYKTYKAYMCLFICLSTKAIHLELVSDLSSDAFIAALRRFIARRGQPHSMYSDNGTNFVGANAELKRLYDLVLKESQKINRETAKDGKEIKWNFIPPKSPHFGGLWEAHIKSVKNHLSRILGQSIFTFEEFQTILNQIEAVVNSRPLSALSDDPNDLIPLTPAHFLIGRSLVSAPDEDYTDIAQNRLSTFQRLQQIVQHFWKRWQREYLHQLQTKPKWRQPNKDLKIGTLVLLIESNQPVASWKLGRITQLWPGSDTIVRVVTVRTATSEFKRAVTKICILPLDKH